MGLTRLGPASEVWNLEIYCRLLVAPLVSVN